LSTINYTEYLRKDKKCRPGKAYRDEKKFKLMDKRVIQDLHEDEERTNHHIPCNEKLTKLEYKKR
jgi:predicted transcriptional regulator